MTTQQPLGEIAEIVRGISFPKDAKSLVPRDGYVACLRTTNVQREVEWDDLWYVPAEYVKRQEQFVQPGDILISTANSYELVGKVALVSGTPRQATLGAFISLIRPRPGIEPKFLYHQLAWGRTQSRIRETASTTTNISNVSSKKLAALELVVLPLGEQRCIVAEFEKQFSRLDEAVVNLKRVKTNAQRLVSSVLLDATMGRLFSSSDASWRTVRVCEAGDVLLGRQRAPQYLTGRWSRKYLRVANIKDDTIDYSDVETMDFDEAHFAKYQLVPGDILVSEGQSPELLGQSAIFRGFAEPLCFQKTLHRFRAHPAITTPEFAQIVFRSHVRSGVFRRLGSITTNIGHLTLEKFKAAPFPLPSLDDQRRIVAEVDRRLSVVREVAAEADANLRRAAILRESVLVKTFGGGAPET